MIEAFAWLALMSGALLFLAAMLLIDYACGTYFRHKFNHFKQISSEMNPSYKPGEGNAENAEQ